MAQSNLPHPTTDEALTVVAETVTEVAMQLRGDIDLVAHVCASHDQALLAIMDEIEQLRIASAQLFVVCGPYRPHPEPGPPTTTGLSRLHTIVGTLRASRCGSARSSCPEAFCDEWLPGRA